MNSKLKWALGLTAMLSLFSILFPNSNQPIDPAMSLTGGSIRIPAESRTERQLPSTDALSTWSEARSDPFWSKVVKVDAEQAHQKASPREIPMVSAPAPLPMPPRQTYSFLGKFIGPDGNQKLFIANERDIVEAVVGLQTSDGYKIIKITNDGISLQHDMGQVEEFIFIPPQ